MESLAGGPPPEFIFIVFFCGCDRLSISFQQIHVRPEEDALHPALSSTLKPVQRWTSLSMLTAALTSCSTRWRPVFGFRSFAV